MVDGGDLEEPERAEEARSGRKPIGYAVAGLVVAIVVAGGVALLASGSGGSEGSDPAAGVAGDSRSERERVYDLLPENGRFPAPRKAGMREAARAAGCELASYTVETKNHIASPSEPVRYKSDPPTSGKHHPVPAEDHAYAVSPDVRRIVHTLEHGRVAVWFDPDLPRSARASLKAFYVDDPYQLLLVPDTTGMPYAVAATAWHRNPTPNGTGRLLGCREYSDDLYTALDVFRDENRGHGPELIP